MKERIPLTLDEMKQIIESVGLAIDIIGSDIKHHPVTVVKGDVVDLVASKEKLVNLIVSLKKKLPDIKEEFPCTLGDRTEPLRGILRKIKESNKLTGRTGIERAKAILQKQSENCSFKWISNHRIEFETEEDKTLFLLIWS